MQKSTGSSGQSDGVDATRIANALNLSDEVIGLGKSNRQDGQARRFGIESSTPVNEIAALERNYRKVPGLVVDSVSDVLELALDQIHKPPETALVEA